MENRIALYSPHTSWDAVQVGAVTHGRTDFSYSGWPAPSESRPDIRLRMRVENRIALCSSHTFWDAVHWTVFRLVQFNCLFLLLSQIFKGISAWSIGLNLLDTKWNTFNLVKKYYWKKGFVYSYLLKKRKICIFGFWISSHMCYSKLLPILYLALVRVLLWIYIWHHTRKNLLK